MIDTQLARRALWLALLAIAAAAGTAPGAAQILGPDAAHCSSAQGRAFLVHVSGFKNRAGTVRVRLFGGDPATYFVRERALVRTQVALPADGPVTICVPAPAAGVYALDVRHDVNNDDATNRGDGGGISGNPRLTFWDVILRRRPPPAVTQVAISQGVVAVPITVRYI